MSVCKVCSKKRTLLFVEHVSWNCSINLNGKRWFRIIEIIYFDKHSCEEERESFARRDFVARQVHVVSVQREGVSLITSEFTHLKSLETVSSANFKIATSLDPSLTVDPPVLSPWDTPWAANRPTIIVFGDHRKSVSSMMTDSEIIPLISENEIARNHVA